jgi:hypothetical protein
MSDGMNKLREAAQAALDALENGKRVRNYEGGTKYQPPIEDAAMDALRAALAEPDPTQEPTQDTDQSTDIEILRCAVDRLTQRLAMAEAEITWLRRENESLKAWNATAFPRHHIATGYL